MGINKLINSLQKSLSSATGKNETSRERIDCLLDKLEKKEKKLRQKFENEKNPKKRKELKLQIKIVSTQRKKGKAFRQKH